MIRRCVFLPQAVGDVERCVAWYNVQTPGLGRSFLHDIDRQLRRIAAFPHVYPALNTTCRQAHLPRFPFRLVYREDYELIEVVALFP